MDLFIWSVNNLWGQSAHNLFRVNTVDECMQKRAVLFNQATQLSTNMSCSFHFYCKDDAKSITSKGPCQCHLITKYWVKIFWHLKVMKWQHWEEKGSRKTNMLPWVIRMSVYHTSALNFKTWLRCGDEYIWYVCHKYKSKPSHIYPVTISNTVVKLNPLCVLICFIGANVKNKLWGKV